MIKLMNIDLKKLVKQLILENVHRTKHLLQQ